MQTQTIFTNLYTSKYFKNLPDFKQQRTQAFITLTLTLTAICIFGLFAIMPTLTTIGNLQKQKEDNTFVVEQLDKKTANLKQLTQKYADLQDDITIIFRAIPTTPQAPQLTSELYAISKNTNVNVNRIQISDVELAKTQESADKYSAYVFTLDASGNYIDLMKYLVVLTNFDRVITIDTLSITKNDGKSSGLKMNIRGKAYFKL